VTTDTFTKGQRIGDYEIIGRLRAGGMATLYLGRRHGAAGVSRPVAIKVIHPHLAEDELIVKMFIDEARISSQISHPNVVYIENFGEYNGRYFMVMEYVEGCSLEQVLKTMHRAKEQLEPELAAYIAKEAAAGLHAAHEALGQDGEPLGVVHRDVSPSNILLTRDGRIKVIDFGIAKARGRLGQTKTGASFKGKLRYMSPEQAWGRSLDRRADTYALGIVLWELLTTKQLFRADDDLAVLELVRNPVVPPPSTHNPRVSVALDAVVLRATAKAADLRQPTLRDFTNELLRAMPAANNVPPEALGQLVTRVRETLGLSEAEDQKGTTPLLMSPSGAPEAGNESMVIELRRDTSLGAAVGEVAGDLDRRDPRARPRFGIAAAISIAGLAIAAAVLVVGRSSDHSDRGTTVAPTNQGSPAPLAPAASAVVVPVDAGVATVAPAVDGGPVTVEAAPPRTTPTPPQGTRKRTSKVQAVEVDGIPLAEEPTAATRPKVKITPKTKATSVTVDGTVLAQ